MRAELLLAMLNREYPDVQFLLLTPFVPNGKELADWLDDERSHAITVLAADWQANDRTIGIAYPHGRGRDWGLRFRTLHMIPAIEIDEDVALEAPRPPLATTFSHVKAAKSRVAAATACVLARRPGSSCIVLADSPSSTWEIADLIATSQISDAHLFGNASWDRRKHSDRIELVRRFLETEFSADFRLCELLRIGIAVHHAGLSPEARYLVEWLTEEGDIRILVATTTLAQGVNFPVSSIVLSTHFLYQPNGGKREMSPAAFQNLVGRAGRLFQDTLGIVAFAAQDEDADDVQRFVSRQISVLSSALEEMVRDVLDRGLALKLTSLVRQDTRWASFAQYLAHSYRRAENHQQFVADTEKVLRATWGYRRLKQSRPVAAEQLVDATREYATTLRSMGAGVLSLVDNTGFSGESVIEVLKQKSDLPTTFADWDPSALFQTPERLSAVMKSLFGVKELQIEVPPGSQQRQLAEIISMWVRGESIASISTRHFMGTDDKDLTDAITNCCQQLFRRFAQSGAWGLGALQKIANVDIESLSPEEAEAFRTIPAMVFYGVPTVEAVLMRTLSVPRSVAASIGARFKSENAESQGPRVQRARAWLEAQPASVWESSKPSGSTLTGDDYRRVWRILNGMEG